MGIKLAARFFKAALDRPQGTRLTDQQREIAENRLGSLRASVLLCPSTAQTRTNTAIFGGFGERRERPDWLLEWSGFDGMDRSLVR
jgi:hypothetical protein